MADAEPTSSSHSARPMDVFGNVELLTPKAPPVAIHTRELQQIDDSPPVTPYTPVGIRPPSSRAGSRRTQSVDVASKHLNAASPLGPTRRKRGEREKEREKIRAELDAAPSFTLDPRIAHDVLDLERRFVAASKGKSPAPRPPHRTHRPRNSLPSSAVRPHIPVRADSVDHQALSALPESDTTSFSGGDQKPPELVGPALPSSGVQSPTSPPAPTQPLPPAQPVSPPTALKVDKSAYAALLPTSDPEASGSGAEIKRTSKAAKRTSLTAMLGLGSRKKPKEAGHQKDSAPEEDKISPLRPSPKRVETHHTTRTMNTILTTHTGATAGSIESGSVSGLGSGHGHGQGLSPVSGAKSASAASSNPKLVEEPFAVIEPSAKTLARAAATRDQLQKRYAMLYASLGDTSSSMGSEEHSVRSVSGSGSMLKRASPGPGSSSIDSYPRPSSKEHPPLKARGLNLLEVVRWRSGVLQRARRSAEINRAEIEGRHGEEWDREVERRIRDAPPGEHYAGSGVPAYQNLIPAAALGDSLPEANSLSWLPYLEPVFAEERARAEGSGEFGLGGRPLGSGPDVPKGMSAWYVLASFVEGYVAAKEQDEQKALAMEAELGVVRGADASFVSEGFKSFVSDGPRSLGSDMHGRPLHPDLHIKDLHSKSISSDVRAKAIVNAAYAHARGAGNGAISDDAASGTGSRFAAVGRALRPKSRRNSTIADSISGVRSRQGSVGLGTTSEPPSPSHFTAFSQPILSSATPSTSQLSHPGARALGPPNMATWLSPPNQGETRPARSQSGSRLHSRTHSRSQSQARSISAGNSGHKSTMSGDLNLNGLNFNKPAVQPGVGEGKSMSPAASRMNLANILMGGAAVFGLTGMRRGTGAGRQYMAKEGVSGSENENDSGQVSSDMSPSDGARARRRRRMGTEFSGAGASDGEGGRVKRRKKTWRERENEKGAVPLSDGGEVDEIMRRRSMRPEKTVMLPVEVQTDKSDQEEEDKERVYERKNRTREEARETLEDVNARLHSFAQLLEDLNTVHHEGADIFGEMFMAVPEEVVTILTPDLSEDEGTPLSASPITPTHPHNLIPLREFAKKLDTLEGNPIAVDHVGRATLGADLPLAAVAAVEELDRKLNALAKQIGDLRQFCDDAEQERRLVKQLYEKTAGSVGTTYPECTRIEQLLSTLVTEDMPWLPSWLPLWVRHLLEIFSNQIQFMVENGLRIYGYVYSVVSVFVFLFTLIFSVLFMFARFVRAYWWGFLASGLAGLAYLMTRPPEGMGVVDMGT